MQTFSLDVQRRTPMRLLVVVTVTIAMAIASSCAPQEPSAGTQVVAPDESPPPPGPGFYYAATERMGIAGCPLFHRNHVFHAEVQSLDVHENSGQMIDFLSDQSVRSTMKSAVFDQSWPGTPNGHRAGFPISIVDSTTTPLSEVINRVPPVGGPHLLGYAPIPMDVRIEGDPTPAWDKHAIVFDKATCRSYELYLLDPYEWHQSWTANDLAVINMKSNAFQKGVTNAGVSLLAGLVRYDEVMAGSIDHALAITIPKLKGQEDQHVWPARYSDGISTDPNALPMGTWLRLKDTVDLSRFPGQARSVVEALRKHGGIIMDSNMDGIAINGESPDCEPGTPGTKCWNDTEMATLENLTPQDFEVVDTTSLFSSSLGTDHSIR